MMPFGCVCFTGHITCVISLKVGKYIDMVEFLPPYCFGDLIVKNETHISQNRVKSYKNNMYFVCVRPKDHIFVGYFDNLAGTSTFILKKSCNPFALVVLEKKMSQIWVKIESKF